MAENDNKPIEKPNTHLTQVVHSGAKPRTQGDKPPAQLNPNLGQPVIKAPKVLPGQA